LFSQGAPSCRQRIVFLVVLIALLAVARIHILPAVLGILSRFGKISVPSFNAGIVSAMRQLSFHRRLAMLLRLVGLDRTFVNVIILLWHMVPLLEDGEGDIGVV